MTMAAEKLRKPSGAPLAWARLQAVDVPRSTQKAMHVKYRVDDRYGKVFMAMRLEELES